MMGLKYIYIILIISLNVLLSRECLIDHGDGKRLNRPERHAFAPSISGHFYIHYDTTGNNAPDLLDVDPQNGVPDYVDAVGVIADSAHHVLVDVLGYEEEPFDGEGGYDIYIQSYSSGMYGFNYHDGNGTSYMKIDNDYLGYNLDPMKIMQITVGHEYFHALHWGYRFSLTGNQYFYEMSAMWFEDVLIPDGNDYLDGWVDPLLNNPIASFDNTGNGYELGLFGHYLSSYLDPKGSSNIQETTIIREMWERFGSTTSNAFSAVKHVLDGQNYSLTFLEAWADFMSRNLYNGKYDDMQNPFYYYEDQALINPISTSLSSLNESLSFTLQLDDESVAIASYSLSEVNTLIDILHSANGYVGRLALVTDNQEDIGNNLYWARDTSLANSSDQIHFIYGTEGQDLDLNVNLQLSEYLLGDLNDDGGWNVMDVVALVNCILEAACEGYGYLADINGDGGWNVIDVVALANCVLSANCNEI